MGETQFLEQPANCHLANRDSKTLFDHTSQVGATPAHDAVFGQGRPTLDNLRQFGFLRLGQLGWLARRRAIDQALGAAGIEAMNPIAQRLSVHPSEHARRRPRHAAIDPRYGLQTAILLGVLAGASSSLDPFHMPIRSQPNSCRHRFLLGPVPDPLTKSDLDRNKCESVSLKIGMTPEHSAISSACLITSCVATS